MYKLKLSFSNINDYYAKICTIATNYNIIDSNTIRESRSKTIRLCIS